jgi:hypothetical protein
VGGPSGKLGGALESSVRGAVDVVALGPASASLVASVAGSDVTAVGSEEALAALPLSSPDVLVVAALLAVSDGGGVSETAVFSERAVFSEGAVPSTGLVSSVEPPSVVGAPLGVAGCSLLLQETSDRASVRGTNGRITRVCTQSWRRERQSDPGHTIARGLERNARIKNATAVVLPTSADVWACLFDEDRAVARHVDFEIELKRGEFGVDVLSEVVLHSKRESRQCGELLVGPQGGPIR